MLQGHSARARSCVYRTVQWFGSIVRSSRITRMRSAVFFIDRHSVYVLRARTEFPHRHRLPAALSTVPLVQSIPAQTTIPLTISICHPYPLIVTQWSPVLLRWRCGLIAGLIYETGGLGSTCHVKSFKILPSFIESFVL
jgi:hypothetical protein